MESLILIWAARHPVSLINERHSLVQKGRSAVKHQGPVFHFLSCWLCEVLSEFLYSLCFMSFVFLIAEVRLPPKWSDIVLNKTAVKTMWSLCNQQMNTFFPVPSNFHQIYKRCDSPSKSATEYVDAGIFCTAALHFRGVETKLLHKFAFLIIILSTRGDLKDKQLYACQDDSSHMALTERKQIKFLPTIVVTTVAFSFQWTMSEWCCCYRRVKVLDRICCVTNTVYHLSHPELVQNAALPPSQHLASLC